MTGDDVLDIDPYYGHAIKDRPLIAIDRVRFAGEPVVAIAAETPEIAADAAELVEIDYEPMEAVLSIDEALAEDAPHLHVTDLLRKGLFHGLGEFKLDPGNICYHHQFRAGRSGRCLRPSRYRGGRRIHVSGGLSVRHGDPHHDRRVERRRR